MPRHPFIPLFLLLLALPNPPAAAGTFTMAAGFNFFSPVAATTMTSQDILATYAEARSVFRFDPPTQRFVIHLRLPDGSLFGTVFPLRDGQGIVVQADTTFVLAVSESGAAASPDPFTELYAGFNFIGLPGRGGIRASSLLAAEAGLQSVFRWDGGRRAFAFLIRLPGGTNFGTDFEITDGEGYFLNHATGNRVSTAVPVDISGFQFAPASVTIAAGQSVTWTNKDSTSHTVTSDSGAFASGTLGTDATYTRTFSAKGTFSYHCSFHPFMTGTVVVQ